MKLSTPFEQSPLAEAAAIVLLRPNGTFEWNECKGDFTAFLAAKMLYNWKRALRGNSDGR